MAIIAAGIGTKPAAATDHDVFPADDLRSILPGLAAGDQVTIHAGTYSTHLVFWPPATSALVAAGSAVYAAADDFNGSGHPGPILRPELPARVRSVLAFRP